MEAIFRKTMAAISCTAPLRTIGSWTILHVPKAASAKLPSRGLVMIEGTLNGTPIVEPLEPDGAGSHWLKVEKTLQKKSGASLDETATLTMEPAEIWPEPEVPADLKKALAEDPKAHATWKATTVAARWDWIRWVRSTAQAETRAKRIRVACSKLTSGMKRPCCFNRSMCTEPSVSKSGVLLSTNS